MRAWVQRVREWRGTPAGRRAVADLVFFAVLFAFVGIAYRPALNHPPRADQWCFLTDTAELNTVAEAVAGSYSYNRTRLTVPGDTDLFRPVLFALLATEKVLFDGRLPLYQGLGLVLHAGVCVLLLLVIRRAAALLDPASAAGDAGRDPLGYATVAFFALNPCVQELVIWAHLHGYLLFVVLSLGATACVLRAIADRGTGERVGGSVAAAWALVAVAAFTYELGQVVALVLGGGLALALAPAAGWKRAGAVLAAFALVPVAYQVVNRLDLEYHRGRYAPDDLTGEIVRRAATRATLEHAARFGVFTGVQPFVPSVLQTAYHRQRLEVSETVWDGSRLRAPTPALAVSGAVLAAGALLAGAGLVTAARNRSLAAAVAVGIPVGLYAAYAGITVLGRMNMRPGPTVLAANCYYTYTALAFALFGLGALWCAARGARAEGARRALAVGLLLLTAHGAELVWQTNRTIDLSEREKSRPIRAVLRFVDQHRHEPDFSFAIDYAHSDPIVPMHDRPTPELLFSRWTSVTNPKYRVTVRDGKALVQPPPSASNP